MEVLVSLVILGIVVAVIGGIYTIGLKAVSSTGPQSRLLGAHDLMILEQDLGRDGARAVCIHVPGPAATGYGSCARALSGGRCAASQLCIGWPQQGVCHVASYNVGTATDATRTEYAVSGGATSQLTSVPLARIRHLDITVGTPVLTTPPGEMPPYSWVQALPVTLSVPATAVTSGPSARLTLQPIATDPAASVYSAAATC